VPDPAQVEAGAGAAIEDAILIMPGGGGEAGLETLVDAVGGEDRHRVRLGMIVQRLADLERIPVAFEVEMHHLAERMNPRVGTSGGLGDDALATETLDRLLEQLLHRQIVRLPLPAAEEAAVIFDGEAVARHG
jgi:hypothetical protein